MYISTYIGVGGWEGRIGFSKSDGEREQCWGL